MGAVEVAPRDGAPGARAFDIFLKCFELGLMLRQTGDVLALSAPLVVTEEQISSIVDMLGTAIETAD